MATSDFIRVLPNNRESVMLAYSYGLIEFETMMKQLKEITDLSREAV